LESSNSNWIKFYAIGDLSTAEKYVHSMYFSVITLTNAKGNILPSNSGEIVFLIFASLYAAFFLSYLIYSIGHAFKKLNKQSTRYLNQLASIKKYHIVSNHTIFSLIETYFWLISVFHCFCMVFLFCSLCSLSARYLQAHEVSQSLKIQA